MLKNSWAREVSSFGVLYLKAIISGTSKNLLIKAVLYPEILEKTNLPLLVTMLFFLTKKMRWWWWGGGILIRRNIGQRLTRACKVEKSHPKDSGDPQKNV